MKKLFLFLLLALHISILSAQEGYPKPTAKNILFYIQHSRGKNTFIYEPNFKSPNRIDEKNPVLINRQLFDLNGEIKPLTNIQRKYAYGIRTEKIGPNYFEIELVSYPRQKLFLKVDKNNKPYVESTISGQYMHVKNLFIKLKEGTSGLNVKADYIIFHGIDHKGKSVQAKLIP